MRVISFACQKHSRRFPLIKTSSIPGSETIGDCPAQTSFGCDYTPNVQCSFTWFMYVSCTHPWLVSNCSFGHIAQIGHHWSDNPVDSASNSPSSSYFDYNTIFIRKQWVELPWDKPFESCYFGESSASYTPYRQRCATNLWKQWLKLLVLFGMGCHLKPWVIPRPTVLCRFETSILPGRKYPLATSFVG